MKIKVLIADDHQLVLDGISSMIECIDNLEVIAKANDGKEALDFYTQLSPDIVILDIDMPRMNGLEACRLIKEINLETKVLILTMHNEASLIKKVMEIGADGYMLKNSDRDEFLLGLNSVLKGRKYFSSEVTESLINQKKSQFTNKENSISELISQLTERERDILIHIAEGFSNKEIGEKLFISHRTVDTHRTNLMKKLGIHNIAGLIRIALQTGLIS